LGSASSARSNQPEAVFDDRREMYFSFCGLCEVNRHTAACLAMAEPRIPELFAAGICRPSRRILIQRIDELLIGLRTVRADTRPKS
jgi:hypothetical protein